jgi:hypothetical protein
MTELSLMALLASIRERLDALNVAPLSDEDLAHLVAINEWLTGLGGADV